MNRRTFLKGCFGALGAAALGRSSAARASGDPTARRHFIHLMAPGGWDSLWFHNGVTEAELGAYKTPAGAIYDAGSGVPNFDLHPQNLMGVSDTFYIPGWHQRYADRDTRALPRGGTLGPGMSMFSPSELERVAVWRGLVSEGGHGIGNEIITTGTTIPGTSSYTTLIAQALAHRRGALPLHHVSTGGTSCPVGPILGPAEPVIIDEAAAFRSLAAPLEADLPPAQRAIVNAAVRELGSDFGGQLQHDASRAQLQAFMGSFDSSVSTLESSVATLDVAGGFPQTLARYRQGMVAAMAGHLFTRVFPATGMASGGVLSAAFKAEVEELAFRFALADFLVRKDLSAVVDLQVWCGDPHQYLDTQCLRLLAVYAGVKMLLQGLAAEELPGGQGKSVLDVTTLAMVSELDRSATVSAGSPEHARRAGTNHHSTTSVLLAGAGIKGGRVIGGFKTGHAAHAPFTAFAAYHALPIDRATGEPSLSGEVLSARCLFPTLLDAFGARAHSQIATTGAQGVPGVLMP